MNLFSTEPQNVKGYLKKQKIQMGTILAIFTLMALSSSRLTDFHAMDALTAVPAVLKWLFTNMIPDARAVSRLPKILDKMLDTVLMSVMASVTAALAAFLFALMGSLTTSPGRGWSVLSRGVASVFRNIPIVAWAMIFLLTFGQSSFTGFLALFFASFGFLTRAFIETIDEASPSTVEALRAVGANYPQMVVQAVIPSSLPQLVSWVLYMIEVNIRSATLVGLLTGSGIGFLFSIYYKSLQYKSAALLIIIIAVVILLIEFTSNSLRRKIL